jgi:protein-S-isoprenylcysteine O-methyltransferase Ste14
VAARGGSATLKAEKPMKANLLTLAIVIITVAFLVVHSSEVDWSTAKVIGAVIVGISFPLFVLARWQLGSSFSVKAKASRLVTTGLYSRIRNPIYLFGGLFIVGLSLFLSPWGPLAVALVIVPMQVVRARREERVLAEAFGEEYVRYKSKTWF